MKSLAILSLATLTLGACSAPETSSVAMAERSIATAPEAQSNTLYDIAFAETQMRIDAQIAEAIDVPVPADAGGGYTHEQHKRNAQAIYSAGMLYEATGETQYSDYAANLLRAYAELYPTLTLHPKQKEQSPGRLFWQNLNESWWLVYAIQGYDRIRETLSEEDRASIETGILRPVAEFLSEGSPETFNKIHNHGTWATAAVGMTGYTLGDAEYVEKALLGLDKSGTGGFLRQLDELFSPDGYYNEGPYYQRYALMPFVLFGQAIQTHEPDRGIFERRDGILKKAIYTTIQQNYGGLFFPINDAIKDKGIATTELLYGVSIAYDLTADPALLSVAKAQGKVMPTPGGQAVANALAAGKAEPFPYRSMRLGDGQTGLDGALDIFRASNDPDDLAVVIKNTSQGLGHGHFDKMGLLVFDRGYEILRDYGAARFLNIEAKYGGHYLPENNAYAKQTIAHNALVVDRQSHFGGSTEEGNRHAPTLGKFYESDNLTVTSAVIDTAYAGVEMTRTVAMLRDAAFANPIVVDLVTAQSDAAHDYDLPFHYNGQLVETNLEVAADTLTRAPIGSDNGYQYLWKVGNALTREGLSQITTLLDRRFYSYTTLAPAKTNVIFAELGANDPDFNLRREPSFILRAPRGNQVTYATVIEPHGEYNPIVEYTLESHSRIAALAYDNVDDIQRVKITTKDGAVLTLLLAGSDDAHAAVIDGREVRWTGPAHLVSSTQGKGN